MLRTLRSLLLVALVFVGASLGTASVAHAQYREFSGKIDKISGSKMIVDNRMGDKLSFDKTDSTEVEAMEGAGTWDGLKKDLWVTVYWKMMDKPRKAYRVKVQPPPEEKAEDL